MGSISFKRVGVHISSSSVLVSDLLLGNGNVGNQFIVFQVFPVHIYCGDLVIVVGGVVVNSPV